jgi:hypothetical protein
MNSNYFISLKIGTKVIFNHPLSQLNQLPYLVNKRNQNIKNNQTNFNNNNAIPRNQNYYNNQAKFNNINAKPKSQNDRNNKTKFNFDVIPKFLQNQYINQMNQEFSKKLINKHKIFNKIKTTYFSKNTLDFSENLKNIENEMNFLQESIHKGKKRDYNSFGEMINIINNNFTNEKIKSIQKMDIKNYENMNNDIKTEILNSINLNKKIFTQIIRHNKNHFNKSAKNLKKINPERDSKKNINNYLENNNKINNTLNNILDNKINSINIEKNVKTEPDLAFNNEESKKIIPVTDEQIQIFKSFVGNSKLSNKLILSYFDTYNPKVIIAADKYFKSKYGIGFITLNFVYSIKPPGNKQHKFRFISEIKELFFAAQKDLSSTNIPKLFLENGKELINNRKIKCIGALNLNNNSVIKVFKN